MRTRRRYPWVMLAIAAAVIPSAGAEAQRVDLSGGWWDVHRSGWRVEGRVVLGDRYPDIPPPRRAAPSYRWEGPVYAPAGVRGGRGGQARGGPPFCASGAGHPVHGWRWCEEKGYARDYRRDYGRDYGYGGGAAWHRIDAGDLWFYRVGPVGRELGRRDLEEILGEWVYEDLRRWARDLGVRDGLRGRWVPVRERGVRVLQVRAGRTPVAEFTDWNGDRRVDELMVYAYR
jgi:hypothetical protein